MLTAADNINFTVTGAEHITVHYVGCGLAGYVAL
jgi:hypothetical protein